MSDNVHRQIRAWSETDRDDLLERLNRLAATQVKVSDGAAGWRAEPLVKSCTSPDASMLIDVEFSALAVRDLPPVDDGRVLLQMIEAQKSWG